MALPIENGKVSTPFKKKGSHWSKGYHTGVDFAVPVGTDILAVADGVITKANWGKSYGLQIVQEIGLHSKKQYCIYAHLSKILVKPGDKVKKGQHIAESGNTGNSTGPHLHFELRDKIRWSDGTELDPNELLKS